jgi:lauroyl/myristoyl acyltransferase
VSLLYLFARGATELAGWTPRTVRHLIGELSGAACYWGWRFKRLVTLQNMAQVTDLSVNSPQVRYLALASWVNYGRYVADFLHFPHTAMDDFADHLCDQTADGQVTRWQDYLQQARQPGHGVIITTAHFGNWDMAGAFLAQYVPLSAVAETFSDPQLNQLVQGQRKEKGIAVIPMENSARRILRVLQQNEIVALVVDRPLAPGQGTPVRFFGRTTYVPAGPAVLAIKSGAALLPGYVWYGLHHLWFSRFFPPIFPRSCKKEEEKQEVLRLTQYVYDTLEVMVRSWPTQWYMFRPFWPEHAEDKAP